MWMKPLPPCHPLRLSVSLLSSIHLPTAEEAANVWTQEDGGCGDASLVWPLGVHMWPNVALRATSPLLPVFFLRSFFWRKTEKHSLGCVSPIMPHINMQTRWLCHCLLAHQQFRAKGHGLFASHRFLHSGFIWSAQKFLLWENIFILFSEWVF